MIFTLSWSPRYYKLAITFTDYMEFQKEKILLSWLWSRLSFPKKKCINVRSLSRQFPTFHPDVRSKIQKESRLSDRVERLNRVWFFPFFALENFWVGIDQSWYDNTGCFFLSVKLRLQSSIDTFHTRHRSRRSVTSSDYKTRGFSLDRISRLFEVYIAVRFNEERKATDIRKQNATEWIFPF